MIIRMFGCKNVMAEMRRNSLTGSDHWNEPEINGWVRLEEPGWKHRCKMRRWEQGIEPVKQRLMELKNSGGRVVLGVG